MASEILETYDNKIDIFKYGQLEYFLLFIKDFMRSLKVTGEIYTFGNVSYLHFIPRRYPLYEFNSPMNKKGATNNANLE